MIVKDPQYLISTKLSIVDLNFKEQETKIYRGGFKSIISLIIFMVKILYGESVTRNAIYDA